MTPPNRGITPRHLLIALCGVALIALGGLSTLALERIILDPSNTLAAHPAWSATKSEMRRALAGAQSFQIDTQALAGNQVNLGAWNGCNEITLRRPMTPSHIRFRARFASGAYLYLMLNQPGAMLVHDQPYEAIRFSTTADIQSALLTLDRTGRFHEATPLENKTLTADRWHSIDVRAVGDFLELRVGDDLWHRLPKPDMADVNLAFRGGFLPVAVDDVYVLDETTKQAFTDRFDPYGPTRLRWILGIGLGALLVLAAALLRQRSGDSLAALGRLVSLSVCCTLVLCFAVTLQRQSLAAYPETNSIELRHLAEDNSRIITKRMMARFEREISPFPAPGVHRILFLGSSQTWGAGAREAELGVVPQVEKLLNASVGDRSYECIATAIPSLDSTALLACYEGAWIGLDQDTVVINLSWNDSDPARFGENLRRFVDLNRERGIRTLFVTEAHNSEALAAHRDTETAMVAVGRELNVPVFDAHTHMRSGNALGILWWDQVHPTTFGHRYLAEGIAPFVRTGISP